MKVIILDTETKSNIDIRSAGADRYFSDVSTDCLCLCAMDPGPGEMDWEWTPDVCPPTLFKAIEDADLIVAHNARFDQGVYEFILAADYGFPEIPAEKWYCSAAQCRVNALPGGLDAAARALNGKYRKDHKGTALIKKMSIPPFEHTPELLEEMLSYCRQDVVVTAELFKKTRLMTQAEHQDWLINERINDRGVRIDYELAELATHYAEEEQVAISGHLSEMTGGEITAHTQTARILYWLRVELPTSHPGLDCMQVNEKWSVDKSVRSALLAIDLPEHVRALILMVDNAKSSVAKFQRMLAAADPDDDRVRGVFMFAGAGQTKRFSSKQVQLHNMPRNCLSAPDTEKLRADMITGKEIPDVMQTLSKLLRPAIIPSPDHVFVVGDWSAIEARVLPWLAASNAADGVLEVFDNGEDIYIHTAETMKITDRFIGKVATLALGYQGGVHALQVMAKNYGLKLTDKEAQAVVDKWRRASDWAVRLWSQCDGAAHRAMKTPGSIHNAGRLAYTFTPDLLGGTLVCVLPSGGWIQYPRARLEAETTRYGTKLTITYAKAALTPAADATEWPRASLYGGLLAQGACQAVAADILREALRELDEMGLPVVAHIHDEIVLEVPRVNAKYVVKVLAEVMNSSPAWAEELPLKAVPVIMERFGK